MSIVSFLIVFILCFATIGCSEPAIGEEPGSGNIEPGITIHNMSDIRPVLPHRGGSAVVEFTADSEWTAYMSNDRADQWISLKPVSGNKGSNSLTIIAKANDSYDERNATVVLKCGSDTEKIVVTQKQKDAITVTSSKYEVNSDGGKILVQVASNVQFELIINDSWISRTEAWQGTRAMKSEELYFTVEPNDTGEPRQGTIVLKSGSLSETITVYQTFERYILLTQKSFTVPEEGGGINVEIKSTVEYKSRILSGESWISEIADRAVSTHTHHYSVSPNEAYDARTAEIVFYDATDETLADTVSVFQMYKGAIVVAQEEYEFDANGGDLDLNFQTNLNVDVSVSVPWIKSKPQTKSLTEHALRFEIENNDEHKVREGHIIIKDKDSDRQQTITVKQGFVDFEREALIAFYEATGGPDWANNTNWCSDRPLEEWFGVNVNSDGFVSRIHLFNNRLSGTLPDVFDRFPHMYYINLGSNDLRGELPQSFFTPDFRYIYLHWNQLEGTLSEKVGNCKNLEACVLSHNNFTGPVPASFGHLAELTQLDLMLNKFSGELPPEIIAMETEAENDSNLTFFLEPQQAGYSFTVPATREMIDLGGNFFLHPDGVALEYRQGVNKIITYEEAKPLMQSVYSKFNDVFDFVVFIWNVGNMEEIAGELAGQCFPMSNNVQGIGRDIFDDSAQLGSSGRLKSFICLSDRRQIRGSFLHELMHSWGAPDFGQQGVYIDGTPHDAVPHWGISSVNGLLGGFDMNTLERNVDGNPNKYKAKCSMGDTWFGTVNSSSYAYGPLELYLMGLLPPEEVPDIHYFTSVSGSEADNPNRNGVFYAEEEKVLSIEGFIDLYGKRIPDNSDSQKDFTVLTVVITKDPVNDREWGLIESDILRMQKQGSSGYLHGNMNFYEATGGKGTLTFGNLDRYRK